MGCEGQEQLPAPRECCLGQGSLGGKYLEPQADGGHGLLRDRRVSWGQGQGGLPAWAGLVPKALLPVFAGQPHL